MNLLQVDTEVRWGGGQQQVQHLCAGLVAGGHDVSLVCHRDGALRRRLEDGPVRILPLASSSELDPRGIISLARILRRGRFQLMHMHSSRAHTMGVAAGALTGFRPRLVTRRSFHALRRDPFNRWKYGRGIDRAVAISHAVQQSLIDSGIPPAMVDLVSSGIVPPARVVGARASLLEELRLPGDACLVVCVANLVRVKGHQVLIEAMKAVAGRWPNLQLILAGDGPLRRALQDSCTEAGLGDRVHFAGFRNDIPRLLSAAHLAVTPSLSEGLGLAVLDALAMELPVVASDTGGIPEIIRHRSNGLLVPPGDPAALARALEEVLADPKAAARLGRNGRKLVLERYSVESMVAGTEAVYRRVIKE